MPRVLIVGFGNPLRSDDGLGWHAAQELSQEVSAPEVKVIGAHQLTPELAEEASAAELVLLLMPGKEALLATSAAKQFTWTTPRQRRLFILTTFARLPSCSSRKSCTVSPRAHFF